MSAVHIEAWWYRYSDGVEGDWAYGVSDEHGPLQGGFTDSEADAKEQALALKRQFTEWMAV